MAKAQSGRYQSSHAGDAALPLALACCGAVHACCYEATLASEASSAASMSMGDRTSSSLVKRRVPRQRRLRKYYGNRSAVYREQLKRFGCLHACRGCIPSHFASSTPLHLRVLHLSRQKIMMIALSFSHAMMPATKLTDCSYAAVTPFFVPSILEKGLIGLLKS
jgi:hypothetical protein